MRPGAATSLALALLVGGRVFAALKQSLGWGEWIRRVAGVAVLAAVAAIALGVDTGLLTRVSLASNAPLEQRLLDTVPSGRRCCAGVFRGDARRRRDDERQPGDDDEGQAAGGPEELTVEGAHAAAQRRRRSG